MIGPSLTVFVSATTRDLSEARTAVEGILLGCDIRPKSQNHFPPDHRTLPDFLRRAIHECDAVVCLVGRVFGEASASNPLRSYTQAEYDDARAAGKPVFIFMTSGLFQPGLRTEDSPAGAELQKRYRDTLLKEHKCETFDTIDQLKAKIALAIPRIRAAVERPPRRRRRWPVVAACAVVLALGAAAAVVGRDFWLPRAGPTEPTKDAPSVDELAEAKSAANTALKELDTYVKAQPERHPRGIYVRGRFTQLHGHAADVVAAGIETGDLTVLRGLYATLVEARFIAGLAFEGYPKPGNPSVRYLPSLSSVSNWVQNLNQTGLLRQADLPERIRAGSLSDPDSFYQVRNDPAPRPNQISIDSVASLAIQLPLHTAGRIGRQEYIRRHSLKGTEREIAMLEAEVEALTFELETVPQSMRPTWIDLQTSVVAMLKYERAILEIVKDSIKLMEDLHSEFAAAGRELLKNERLSDSARRTIFTELQKSQAAVAEMREFAVGERVLGHAEGDATERRLVIIITGLNQFEEFCKAMRGEGVRISNLGVSDFKPRTEATTEPRFADGNQYLGLGAIAKAVPGK
jgi:hypothetical protein